MILFFSFLFILIMFVVVSLLVKWKSYFLCIIPRIPLNRAPKGNKSIFKLSIQKWKMFYLWCHSVLQSICLFYVFIAVFLFWRNSRGIEKTNTTNKRCACLLIYFKKTLKDCSCIGILIWVLRWPIFIVGHVVFFRSNSFDFV